MKWRVIRIRKETYDRLMKLQQELTEEHLNTLGRRVFFWEILEALMDAWDLTDDEVKAEVLEYYPEESGKSRGGGPH